MPTYLDDLAALEHKSLLVNNPAMAGRQQHVGRLVVQYDRDGTAVLPAWAEAEYAQLVGSDPAYSKLGDHGGPPVAGYVEPRFDAAALPIPPVGEYARQPYVDPRVAPANFAEMPVARAGAAGVHAQDRIGQDPRRTDDPRTFPPGTPPVDRSVPGPHAPPQAPYTDFEHLRESYKDRGEP